MNRTALALTAVAILASSLLAQHSGGPFTGIAAGVRVDDNTYDSGGVQLPADVLLSKRTGFVPVGDAGAPPVAGDPDFRFAQILQGHTDIRINSMSIGIDVIRASTDNANLGTVNPELGSWVGLLFTVDRSSPGASGVVAAEQARADGAAADIFSFVLRESTHCFPDPPCGIVGHVERAFDSSELGLYDGTNRGDITAFDAHIALYRLGRELQTTTLVVNGVAIALPAEPTFFFTVTPATVGNVPAAWWGGSPPSGATVLCTTWDATAQTWATPQPFMDPGSLGLMDLDAIDGLAVDSSRNVLLFSTEDSTRTQIQFAAFTGWDGITKPVRPSLVSTADYQSAPPWGCAPEPGAEPEKVADQTGGGEGIGDFCEFDPGYFLQNGDLPFERDAWLIGTACNPAEFFVAAAGPVSPDLHSSVFRGYDGSNPTLEPYLVGWEPGGPTLSSLGVLFLRIDRYVGGAWVGTWEPTQIVVPRTPATGAGGPTGFPFPIPVALFPIGADVRVGFQWVACNFTACALAHEVTIMFTGGL